MIKKCECCGKDFKITLSEVRHGRRRRCCSRICLYKILGIRKNCKICNKEFKVNPSRKTTAQFCSISCRQMGHRGFILHNKGKKFLELSGENARQWKGENASYGAKHKWLYKWFGKANKCENKEKQFLNFICNNTSKRYEWALLEDKKYERKIEN